MKKILMMAIAATGLLAVPQVQAAVITPSSGVLNVSRWEGNETGQAQIDAAIAGFIAGSTELYKQDVGGGESGALAGSYETEFFNTPLDPKDATITYVSGNVVGPTAYLLVKDGNQEPAWYLFDLTAILNWDGVETLDLNDFWPNQGAISHVTLYGNSAPPPDPDPDPVPEPVSLALLGLGLVSVGALRRRTGR